MDANLFIVMVVPATAGTVGATLFFRLQAGEDYAHKMASAAADLGLSFSAEADAAFLSGLADIYLLQKNGPSGCKNLVTGKFSGLDAAVFECCDTNTNSATHLDDCGTVVRLYIHQRRFPAFLLRPEGFGDSVANFFGQRDIDFDGYPEFSRHYFLKGETEGEGEVRDEFRPNVIQFFESEPGLSCEAKGDRFLLYRENVQVPPERLRYFLELAMTALRQFRPE